MYKWAGKQVYEPLPPLNGHYSIHSVNVSNPAEFGGGKTEALGVKTTADPRGTARTHWAARGKPSHPLDRRNPPTLPSAELPATEEIRRTEENLEDHDYIGRTTVKALRVHTTMVEINRRGIVNSKPECNPRQKFFTRANSLGPMRHKNKVRLSLEMAIK